MGESRVVLRYIPEGGDGTTAGCGDIVCSTAGGLHLRVPIKPRRTGKHWGHHVRRWGGKRADACAAER